MRKLFFVLSFILLIAFTGCQSESTPDAAVSSSLSASSGNTSETSSVDTTHSGGAETSGNSSSETAQQPGRRIIRPAHPARYPGIRLLLQGQSRPQQNRIGHRRAAVKPLHPNRPHLSRRKAALLRQLLPLLRPSRSSLHRKKAFMTSPLILKRSKKKWLRSA